MVLLFTAKEKVTCISSWWPTETELLSHLRAAATILLNLFLYLQGRKTHTNISDIVQWLENMPVIIMLAALVSCCFAMSHIALKIHSRSCSEKCEIAPLAVGNYRFFSAVITLEGNLVILCGEAYVAQSHKVRWTHMDFSVKCMYLMYFRVTEGVPWLCIISEQTQLPRNDDLLLFGYWHASGIIPCE